MTDGVLDSALWRGGAVDDCTPVSIEMRTPSIYMRGAGCSRAPSSGMQRVKRAVARGGWALSDCEKCGCARCDSICCYLFRGFFRHNAGVNS